MAKKLGQVHIEPAEKTKQFLIPLSVLPEAVRLRSNGSWLTICAGGLIVEIAGERYFQVEKWLRR